MKPYKFQSYLKTTIWGGYQIAPFKGIFNAQPNVGESWEISGVPGHESVAINRGLIDDVDEGLTLVELIDKYKGLLVGQKVYKKYGNQFPLLVKFIDSRQDLSVQVHPDDKLAMERHGCQGKTEMWYVIKSDVGSKIYAGLSKSITPDEYERLATAEPQNGRSPMQDVIATHEAHEGDLYFLPAGRLHAIGAGNFLAEIQQTSDITYRVYDFGRKDEHGDPRELHIEQAKMPSTIRYGLLIARPTTVRNPFHNSSTAHILLYIVWSYRLLSRLTFIAIRSLSWSAYGVMPTSTASTSVRERPSSYLPVRIFFIFLVTQLF
jgi:mannose-6-phosphate isomerase